MAIKVEASTNMLPGIARTYRELCARRTAEGREVDADAARFAAEAIDEVAQLRAALKESLSRWEQWASEQHQSTPDVDRRRIAELRAECLTYPEHMGGGSL